MSELGLVKICSLAKVSSICLQRKLVIDLFHLCIEADHPAIALEDCEKMVDAKAVKVAEAIIKANPIDPKASWAHQEGSPGGVTS